MWMPFAAGGRDPRGRAAAARQAQLGGVVPVVQQGLEKDGEGPETGLVKGERTGKGERLCLLGQPLSPSSHPFRPVRALNPYPPSSLRLPAAALTAPPPILPLFSLTISSLSTFSPSISSLSIFSWRQRRRGGWGRRPCEGTGGMPWWWWGAWGGAACHGGGVVSGEGLHAMVVVWCVGRGCMP